MIERRIRSRGYECDGTRTVSLPVFLSYLESLRWEWIQTDELGLVPLLHTGHFFVVQKQIVEIVRRVGMSVDLVLRGSLEHVGRCQARVHHEVVRASDGALVAHAQVTGCWLGPARRLVRLPDSIREACRSDLNGGYLPIDPAHETPLPPLDEEDANEALSFITPPAQRYESLGLGASLPEAPEGPFAEHVLTVKPRDLDIFDHVNASHWLRFADDARILGSRNGDLNPAGGLPTRRVAIHHPREAVAGDELRVRTWPRGDHAFDTLITLNDALVCRATVDV